MLQNLVKSKKINIFTVMTTGRTGSDYLVNCLDGVKGIILFGGKFSLDKYFENKNEKKNQKLLIDSFLKDNKHLLGYDEIEQIDKKINIKKFKKLFIQISNKELSKNEFFFKLYETYHKILKRSFKDIKALVHHSHTYNATKSFIKDFPECKILFTIRDPRANLKSGILSWGNFQNKYKTINHIFFYLRRIRNDIIYALKIKNKKIFIKLEESNLLSTKKKICHFLNVKYDKKIMISTVAGKIWNGDKLSAFKSKGKFNKKIIDNNWRTYFTKKEVLILNVLYSDYEKFYKIKKLNFFSKLSLFPYIFLPFKCERLLIKKNIFSIIFLYNFYTIIKKIIYTQLILLNIKIK